MSEANLIFAEFLLAHEPLRYCRFMNYCHGNEEESRPLGHVMDGQGVQMQYAPNSICYGCGPANEKGLRINSKRSEDGLIMHFTPNEEHQAFPGMINGGIIGSLMDCHGNWAAAIAIMDSRGESEPPCTVTANYSIKLRRPTPAGVELEVFAKVVGLEGDKCNVEMTLSAEGKVCATGEGLFVAVKEGHPAYHRWH